MTPDMLPRSLAPWIVDMAERMDLPIEFFAVPALVAASALVGHRVVALPTARGDWYETATVWGMVIAPPSAGKTPAEVQALHPFRQVMNAAIKAHVGEEPAPRFMVRDATTEKMGEIMATITDGRALFDHRSELSGLLAGFSRRGRESDRAWYLQMWDGKTPLVVDRIGRGTVRAQCGLGVYGAIQPGALASVVEAAKAPGPGADGLLQRFGLMVQPALPRDYRAQDRPPDLTALELACAAFERLAKIDPTELGAHPPFATVPHPGLRFEPRAQREYSDWHRMLMVRIRRNDEDVSAAFVSHLGKLPATLIPLALVFHLLDHEGGPSSGIDRTSLGRALALVTYLESHAASVYGEGASHGAVALARQIAEGRVDDGASLRDIYRAQRSGIRNASDAKAAAAVLERMGWLRSTTTGRSKLRVVVRLRPDLAECLGHGAR